MPDETIQKIAEEAKMIVNGYAFSEIENGFISILNLNHPECAMVINRKGDIIETNMDQIEQKIVMDLCKRNLQFMEAEYA